MDPTNSIDDYIARFPPDVRKLLRQLRTAIRKAAPSAQEKISYGIPTFTLAGNLVHFAGYARHIGFYPGPAGVEAFKDALSGYKLSRATVQFPLDEPLPLALIERIVKFRVKQNLAKRTRA